MTDTAICRVTEPDCLAECCYTECILQDICSFGNLAINKEHWLQIYPPLSFFDHLAVSLKTSVLAPSPILTRIHLLGPTDLLMSTSKSHLAPFYNEHLWLCYRYLESEMPSFEFDILYPRWLLCLSQLQEIFYSETRSHHVNKSFIINVIRLNAVMSSVAMLSVVAPSLSKMKKVIGTLKTTAEI